MLAAAYEGFQLELVGVQSEKLELRVAPVESAPALDTGVPPPARTN